MRITEVPWSCVNPSPEYRLSGAPEQRLLFPARVHQAVGQCLLALRRHTRCFGSLGKSLLYKNKGTEELSPWWLVTPYSKTWQMLGFAFPRAHPLISLFALSHFICLHCFYFYSPMLWCHFSRDVLKISKPCSSLACLFVLYFYLCQQVSSHWAWNL